MRLLRITCGNNFIRSNVNGNGTSHANTGKIYILLRDFKLAVLEKKKSFSPQYEEKLASASKLGELFSEILN